MLNQKSFDNFHCSNKKISQIFYQRYIETNNVVSQTVLYKNVDFLHQRKSILRNSKLETN